MEHQPGRMCGINGTWRLKVEPPVEAAARCGVAVDVEVHRIVGLTVVGPLELDGERLGNVDAQRIRTH